MKVSEKTPWKWIRLERTKRVRPSRSIKEIAITKYYCVDVDEATEGQYPLSNAHKHDDSDSSVPVAKRRKGNDGQRQYNPQGKWVVQAGVFHLGRLAPKDKTMKWPMPSPFDPFFQDLTSDTGLVLAQQRIDLARLYTAAHRSDEYKWSALDLATRLNIIQGLVEIERQEESAQREGGDDLDRWAQLSDDATAIREEFQAAQAHFNDPDDWVEYDARQRVAAGDTKGLRPAASPKITKTRVTKTKKVKTDASGNEKLKYSWYEDELVWCHDYIKDKYDRFVKPGVADTETNIDWTFWHADSQYDSKASPAMKKMQDDHHEHFKGHVFTKTTKKGGEKELPRPIEGPHRSCFSFWKKLVKSEKGGDPIFRKHLIAIDPKYMNPKEKAAKKTAEAAAKAQAGSGIVSAGDADDESTLPKPQVSKKTSLKKLDKSQVLAAESVSDADQQTTLTHRSKGEKTVPGYGATDEEVIDSDPTSVEPGEPARREIKIDEDDYSSEEEGEEEEDEEMDEDTASISAVHLAPAPAPSPSEDTEESDD